MRSDDFGELSLPTLAAPDPDPSWRDEAACRKEGNFKFFTNSEREQALVVCGTCPVAVPCLQFAVENKMKDGVWGGRVFGKVR